MRRLSLRTFPLLVLLLVLGACQAAAPSPTPSPGALSLTDDEGTITALPAVPQRIVSLTPATTELLYALGAGDRLRGRTNYDDYPPAASALPVVATFEGVQIEDVVAIGPDLVIAGGNNFTAKGDVLSLIHI